MTHVQQPQQQQTASKQPANNNGLQSKALTANLNIGAWSARKHDKKVTEEVQEAHNAKKDTGRYNKLLVAKEWLNDLQKVHSAARTFHYENTLPWGDNGDRLLPSANYFTYTQEMSFFNSQHDEKVREIIANIEKMIAQAEQDLNGMFNPADYPTRAELESKYLFKVSFMPLPDIDFRLNLGQTEINNLTQQVETAFRDRINAAVSDTWARIKDQLTHMKERLSDSEAIFKNSLFDNLRDIIDLLPKLNVTDDFNITQICDQMKTLIVDPESVRKNTRLRSQKADEVDAILNQFGSFFQ